MSGKFIIHKCQRPLNWLQLPSIDLGSTLINILSHRKEAACQLFASYVGQVMLALCTGCQVEFKFTGIKLISAWLQLSDQNIPREFKVGNKICI